jgi:hypothetical protein
VSCEIFELLPIGLLLENFTPEPAAPDICAARFQIDFKCFLREKKMAIFRCQVYSMQKRGAWLLA